MQLLEVSGELRPIYGSLGVKRLIVLSSITEAKLQRTAVFIAIPRLIYEIRKVEALGKKKNNSEIASE